jgi:hypothetical protein
VAQQLERDLRFPRGDAVSGDQAAVAHDLAVEPALHREPPQPPRSLSTDPVLEVIDRRVTVCVRSSVRWYPGVAFLPQLPDDHGLAHLPGPQPQAVGRQDHLVVTDHVVRHGGDTPTRGGDAEPGAG